MKILIRTLVCCLSLIATLLCACSTISLRQSEPSYPFPPAKAEDSAGRDPVSIDHTLEQKYLTNPTEPMRVLVRYQQALLWSPIDPAKACALWLEIQGQSRFPLQRLARLHLLETCPEGRGGAQSLDEALASVPEPWLRDTAVRAILKRAERTGQKQWEMKLALELAKSEKLQTEKIRRLTRVRSLAAELGDTNIAAEAKTLLESAAPRFIPNPQPSQYLDVANDLKLAREFTRAREWYAKVVDATVTDTNGNGEKQFTDWEKLKALDGIRMSYKLEKNTDRFIASTRDYAAFARKRFLVNGKKQGSSGKPLIAKYLQTQLTLARAIWTEHSPSEAAALLVKAERDVQNHLGAEESVWIRARIEEEAGRYGSAVRLLETVDLTKVNDADLRSKILWYRAWNMRKANRLPDAIAALERLVSNNSGSLASRNRFWLAKSLKDLGRESQANTHFEWLIENDPLGWYGLLSFRELKRLIPPLGQAEPQRLPSSSQPQSTSEGALMPEERLLIEWLISTGETEIGRKFLDETTADRRASYSDAQTLDLLQLYARTGSFQTMFSRLYELPASTRQRLIDAHPDLLFPQPWKHLVETAALKYNVKPELVYSIMRQESSFTATARSPADAFGLMQLIPEAAKTVEASTQITLGTHEDLYKPEFNIPLGVAFIRGLMNHWGNTYIPTVASYNASEKAIAGWLKTRLKNDPLEFIEDIPYEETRNYIKLVTRNFIFYSRLNSGGAPIAFPEWCLNGLHDVKP